MLCYRRRGRCSRLSRRRRRRRRISFLFEDLICRLQIFLRVVKMEKKGRLKLSEKKILYPIIETNAAVCG